MPEKKTLPAGPDGPETRLLPLYAGFLLSLLGGFLMFAVFPPLNINVMVWIGLVPLLTALWTGKGRQGKRGTLWYALYGWAFGLVYYGGSFWWINEVSTLGFIPLVMYLALYPALWSALMGTVLRPAFEEEPAHDVSYAVRKARWKEWSHRDIVITLKAVLSGASLWVVVEWLRGWVMTGFGWNSLGVGLYDSLALAQFAEYVGVTALSFIPAMANIWLWCVGRRLGKMMLREGRRVSPWDFFALCFILMAVFLWGSLQVNRFAPDPNDMTKLPVLGIQPNYPQSYKWNRGNIDQIYGDMARRTSDALTELQMKSLNRSEKDGQAVHAMLPAWIIWPESSLPVGTFFEEETEKPAFGGNQYNLWYLGSAGPVAGVRREAMADFVLLLGEDEAILNDRNEREKGYNVMAAYPGDYPTRQTYRKSHLVVFGEYIPLREYLPFLEDLFAFSAGGAMGANFDAGTSAEPIDLPFRPGGETRVQAIPSVCFEDTVGRLMRRFVRNAPQVIVNVTNDAWFNHSWANEHHWRNAAFRSIELRRSMVHVANTGVTVALAPNGGVLEEIRDLQGSPFIDGYLFAELPVSYRGYTLYSLAGDWAVLVCALIVVGFLVTSVRRSSRKK